MRATRSLGLRRGLVLLLPLLVSLCLAAPAAAQDQPSSSQVPTQEIVPKPNSGAAPDDAGDRGGALQLALLALVVAGVGLAVGHLVRQSRRARAEDGGASTQG